MEITVTFCAAVYGPLKQLFSSVSQGPSTDVLLDLVFVRTSTTSELLKAGLELPGWSDVAFLKSAKNELGSLS